MGLLLLVACSPIKVTQVEAEKNFTLSDYRTFAFLEEGNTEDSISGNYQEQVALLKREIRKQLQARGLSYQETQPDVQVNIGVMVEEKVQTRETNFRQDAPYYTGQRRYSWKSKEIPVGTYKEGTVTVHLVDREQNNLVWAGEVSSIIPKSEESLEKRISEGMETLFEKVPK